MSCAAVKTHYIWPNYVVGTVVGAYDEDTVSCLLMKTLCLRKLNSLNYSYSSRPNKTVRPFTCLRKWQQQGTANPVIFRSLAGSLSNITGAQFERPTHPSIHPSIHPSVDFHRPPVSLARRSAGTAFRWGHWLHQRSPEAHLRTEFWADGRNRK